MTENTQPPQAAPASEQPPLQNAGHPQDDPSGPSDDSVAAFDLSVVIPAFNESRHIAAAIQSVADYADRKGITCELLVVNDGSTDDTAQIATDTAVSLHGQTMFRLINQETNLGKALTVKHGAIEARGSIILYSDADMSTPIEEYDKFQPWFDAGFAVVIGSRDMPESRLDPPQPLRRRLLGRVFRGIRRLLMLSDLRDTQCGFKAFRKDVAHDVFAGMIETSPAFDCEILWLADRAGHRIKEVGVHWRDDPDSRISATRHGPSMLAALWRIRRRHNGGKPGKV